MFKGVKKPRTINIKRNIMIAELHCHTSEYSACSHVNAVELIKRAYDLGMQAIVITDHHYEWNNMDLTEVKQRAGVDDIFNVLAGQELHTSDYGDILIYGAKETIKRQKLTLDEIREKYPEAAIIWAHPYRQNKIPDPEKLLNPLLDGIEVFNSNYSVSEAARALKDWHKMKFTAISGTDTHALSYTGSYPTIFDHPFSTIEELVAEIKAGRCRPYFKEIPRRGTSDTKVTEITIGPKTSETREKIITKTFTNIDAWKEGERTFYLTKEISKNGFNRGKYRIPRPLDKDAINFSLMEEHISGETLHEKIINANPEQAKEYLRMAARWLAEFHNFNFKITPIDEYLSIEKERLEYYLSKMYERNHEHTERAKQILDEVWKNEVELIESSPESLVQGHGDYHLKNIIIGKYDGSIEEYIAVIDFNSSYQLPKAFDVGTFIAQYRNMFFDYPEVYYKAPIELFFQEYVDKSNELGQNFELQVQLYKARAYLSIIYYLVKVGKGSSENFWTVLVDAERCLAHAAFRK
jgi:3',5'-nucleoside bisphosphate phosphatase